MKPWMIGAAFGVMALSGATVQAAPQDPVGPASVPGFDFWGTGSGAYSYHRLSGDCDTVDHGHGRNAAWGRAMMPLSQIVADSPDAGEHGGVRLRFRCVDGTPCIRRGHLTNITGQASDHIVPFETMDRARAFSQRVAELKIACGIGS